MEIEYLTIKDFAERAGVSQQSIYKRLSKKDNPLQPYLKKVGNKKLLNTVALLDIYGIVSDAVLAENESEDLINQPDREEYKVNLQSTEKNNTERLIDILENQLNEKDRQLLEKDNQISEKDKQINELQQRLAEVHTLLNQQQHLTAVGQQKILTSSEEVQETKKRLFSFLKFWK